MTDAGESEFLRGFRAVFEEANRAWNQGDFQRVYGGLADDFEYRLSSTWPNARPLCGPAEIVAFFDDFREMFPDTRAEFTELFQAGETILIAGYDVTGTGGHSGASVAMEIWQVWELADGTPARVREFHDRESAMGAAKALETAES